MNSLTQVQLTSVCSSPQQDKLLLPQGTSPIGQALVQTPNGTPLIVLTDVRSDPGNAACAQGALLLQLGGSGALVSYRRAGFLTVLRYKRSIWLQTAIASLTFISGLFSGWALFLKSSADPSNRFTYETATVLFVITFALAALKLYKDATSPT
jgi:hypothetical protein